MTINSPLYQVIADTLRAEIVGGAYRVGDAFPREFDLCDRFGVSRHTVRSALSRLEREGLLNRTKSAGTVIRSTKPGSAFVQKLDSVDDLLQYPVETKLNARSLEHVKADTTLARWFETEPGLPLACIRSVRARIDESTPLCWSEIYVREDYAGVFDHVGADTRPVYRIIEDVYGVDIARVEIELGAVTLEKDVAELLLVAEQTPAIRVLRRYYDRAGSVFETSVSLHPEDRFTYKLTFENQPSH